MFKMSLYILKQNETQLLHQSFEEILNQINEQPKIILSGDTESLDRIEQEMRKTDREILQAGCISSEQSEEPSDFSPLYYKDSEEEKQEPMTLYMRFKKDMENDENGKPVHIDFLLAKFKTEFD